VAARFDCRAVELLAGRPSRVAGGRRREPRLIPAFIWRAPAPAAIGARRRRTSRNNSPSHMPSITYIDYEGTARTVEGEIGSTVMETAIKNGIPGIEAECGGACACATCHVHVDEAWRAVVGEPSPMEEDMLDFGYDVKPDSRLSCQIKVTAELDGLVVRTPERQA
jgi:ferredoxin, 2Fe-2S